MASFKFWFISICIFSLVLLSDFALKHWVYHNLPLMYAFSAYPSGGIAVFQTDAISFSIVHAVNKGIALGLFSSMQAYLIWIRWALCGVVLIYLLRSCPKELKPAFAAIFAGALGNIGDYYFYGHVIDMFHFSFFGHSFPIFNIADAAISLAAVWIGWQSLHAFFRKKISSLH